ncbi:MAG TPA: hypothetical protein VHE34_26885 [Puia sp.]|uniref:hypothetical protein n=1 Tax=Puia sp. TaxID=2045100 RepID=UPI002D08D717|nr:hypothetical protein [Puia sp.]HVU98888.1 hypothetical protein [Puia sp.]
MKKVFFTILLLTAFVSFNHAYSQGCVAIRSTGGFCTYDGKTHVDSASKWQFTVNNRYYKSFRHYVGTAEQKQRQTLGNEVINHAYTLDMAIYRIINPRWSIMLDLPVSANARSQTYTQSGVLHRFSTHDFGAGDIRLAVYSWLLDPVKMPKGNIQIGLGIKLPTGEDNYQDYFRTSDSTKVLGPVDQSIQLGDGGTGITFELNGFYNFSHTIGVYGNFFYLANPRDQNAVPNYRGTPSATSLANGSSVMSVPDQMLIRAGISAQFNRLTASAGFRDDCLPVHDLIGQSNGFRRPGYILSAEPGLTYVASSKVSIYSYVPIALVRNRTQSVPDKITTALTGKYTQGDAAFADYVINIGANFRF